MGCIARLVKLLVVGVGVLILAGWWWYQETRMAPALALADVATRAPRLNLKAADQVRGPVWVRGTLQVWNETFVDPETGSGPYLFLERVPEVLGSHSLMTGGDWRTVATWTPGIIVKTGVPARFVDESGSITLTDWNAVDIGSGVAIDLYREDLTASPSRRDHTRVLVPGQAAWALGEFWDQKPHITVGDVFYLVAEDPASFAARLHASVQGRWWQARATLLVTLALLIFGLRWVFRRKPDVV